MKADCGCGEVMARGDGDWIKVGGMVSAAKKIRTRAGAQMMFATLDDLEGSVEVVVFEKALAAAEGALADDAIVLVRGRVDHKEAGRVCVVAQDVERFEPSDGEIARAKEKVAKAAEAAVPRPLHLRVDAGQLPATALEELKRIVEDFPGESEVVLEMETRGGPRRLRLGNGYRVAARHAGLKAELDRVFGPAMRPAAPASAASSPAAPEAAVAVTA